MSHRRVRPLASLGNDPSPRHDTESPGTPSEVEQPLSQTSPVRHGAAPSSDRLCGKIFSMWKKKKMQSNTAMTSRVDFGSERTVTEYSCAYLGKGEVRTLCVRV